MRHFCAPLLQELSWRIDAILTIEFDYVLTDNASLNQTWSEFETPVISHGKIDSDGYGACRRSCFLLRPCFAQNGQTCAELNVKEIRPPRMDDSGRTKYPVLFRVYVHNASRANYIFQHLLTSMLQVWRTCQSNGRPEIRLGLVAPLSCMRAAVYCCHCGRKGNGI